MDPYDPDEFDWGDEQLPGIPLEDLPNGVVEMAVSAALKASEATFGWHWSRTEDVKESARKIFKHKVVITDEGQQAWIRKEWPEYHHVFEGATVHHDHPVSHTCTELNEIEMVSRMVQSGETWIDLFGNSARDTKYKRKCINLYGLNTPKDYLRYQHVDQKDMLLNMNTLCDPTSSLGKIDSVTCTHALYYLSMTDIARIVNTSKGRRLSALVHRHKDSSGTMNFGELKYDVSREGWVHQENVLTGESYSHLSLEALFHQASAKTTKGGVAWTSRKLGGETFLLEFVGCPDRMCEEFIPLHNLAPETRATVECGSVKIRTFLGWTWTTYDGGDGEVQLRDVDLLTKLRRYVSGKSRTPRLKTELGNLARRLTNRADIISIHGGGCHDVEIANLQDYVLAAFYMDVKHELEVAIAFHKKNEEMVTALNAYYDDGVMPTDVSTFVETVSKVRDTVSWGVPRVAKTVVNSAAGWGVYQLDATPLSVEEWQNSTKPGKHKLKPISKLI